MPPRQKRPDFLTPEAFELLVRSKHAAAAWSVAFDPEADRNLLDAVTLDASCQSRTVGLLNGYKLAHEALLQARLLDRFVELAHQFLVDHAGDLPTPKVKMLEDVFGGVELSDELGKLLLLIEGAVGTDQYVHAGLCFTHSVNSNMCVDELGCLFGITSDPIYVAEISGGAANPPTRVNHSFDLRAMLGEKATTICTEVARAAASQKFRDTVPGVTPTPWDCFPDQLAAALYYMGSSVKQKQDRDIPLQALVPQALVALQNAFLEGHSLITQHRRIRIIHSSHVRSGEERADVIYQLTAMRVYHWVPDRAKGRFVLHQKVPAEKMDLLSLFMDMPSYYYADSHGDALASPHDAEFFAAIEHPKTNIAWLITVPLVVHPPFTGLARDSGDDHLALYAKICAPQFRVLNYSRLWCDGFTFGDGTEGARQASLNEIVLAASAVAASCGLTNCAQFTRPVPDGGYERRREPMDCAVSHILVKTYAEAARDCAAHLQRHSVDNRAVFGPHVARWGKSGISFRTQREADFFTRARSFKHTARKEYVENYPHNIAFHPE
ncbi:hypothetical protein DFH06DRAFT_1374167 [Mycena polygramma]|nr:hypothetical protein DFH06DRAFT_1374167 [Mycena polygramma]